jgi:ABC-2 type transport system permease protein
VSSLFLTATVLQVYFKAPLFLFLGILLLTLPGAVCVNYFGLCLDLIKPKINWENEQQAVKQNFNVLFQMMAGIFAAGIIVAPGSLLAHLTALEVFICLFVTTGAVALMGYRYTIRAGCRLVGKLTTS